MNSRRLTLALILFSLLLATSVTLVAQQGHTLRGKVRNAVGGNISNATVILEKNGAMVNQTVTNNEGDFFFSGLTDTSYEVLVSVSEYNAAREIVLFVRSVGPNDPGESRTVEITLTRKEGIRPPRAGLNFVQDTPKPARDAFESASKLVRERRRPEAIAALENAINIFPDYFDARLALANELAIEGRFSNAIIHLDKARGVNDKDDRVFDLFARILMQQGKYAIAARIYGEAARLNPTEPQYLLSQGTAFIEQASIIDPSKSQAAADERKYALEEAERVLKQAQQRKQANAAEIHRQLARLYERKGDLARAALELEQYLKANPGAANAAAIREAIKKLRASQARP
jgi:tetratricopeptide (TPR) repeat protein